MTYLVASFALLLGANAFYALRRDGLHYLCGGLANALGCLLHLTLLVWML
jgi:hypothetical protein